ncbi:MAG: amidohydrolase [Magnetovibrio sp.]|nr:amidohydrolase [Magnetovibrio sp.]|tara:strand:- start:10689 stop:11522 length:834 start_codon:yes stop_codon:yes gene_type:complete
MKDSLKVACIQITSGESVQRNLDVAWGIVRKACDAGADLIALPEATNVMASNKNILKSNTEPEENNQALFAFQSMAQETGAWILVGSLLIDLPKNDKMANRSFLINNNGAICARYDKIHMFDVELGGAENHLESDFYNPGNKLVLATTPWGKLGMTICYDLRFPYLYRALGHAGARMLSIPSAFTRVSGRAHWHVLQRARAIETGSYVIAPAQCGNHPGNRQTYGHSLIVNPWGEVVADGGEDIGFIIADVDLTKVDEARNKIPAIRHDRDFELINY